MSNILIVEDCPTMAKVYEHALRTRAPQHSLQVVGTVAEGLRALEENRPQLLITDLNLPDESGLLAARAAARASIPCIVVSGRDDENGLAKAVAFGVRDFLLKPFSFPLLISKVERHLKDRSTALDLLLPGGEGNAFGRFKVTDRIGQGGGGTVLRAWDKSLRREVALKVHRAPAGGDEESDRLNRRFLREAYTLSAVSHENLVQIYGHGSERGFHYISLELIEGQTLRRYVERAGRLTDAQLVGLLRGLARGLDAIHGRGLVHRDLKPENVVLRGGRPESPVLIDFGLTKLARDRSLTKATERYGTPAYMAPEQICTGEVGPSSDLFSLGLLGCYAASGQRAFADLQLRELLIALASRPVRIPPVCAPLARILRELTRIRPGRRLPSAAELLAQLDAIDEAELRPTRAAS